MTRLRTEWKRTLWGLVGLLLITGGGAAIWVHHVWSHSDRLLEQAVRANLDRLTPGINVEFSSCRFDLLRRVRFDDVELTTVDGQPLASVPRVIVSIDREALARRQQLLIQKVTLHEPRLRLARDIRGGWNWEDLAPEQSGRTMFPEWTIDRGQIEIALDADSPQVRSLSNLNLRLVPAGSDRYLVDGTGQIENPDASSPEAQLTLSGHWQVTENDFSISGQLGDLVIEPSLHEFISTLSSGTADDHPNRLPFQATDVTLAALGDLDFRVSSRQLSDDLDYKLLLTLKQGRLQLPYPSDQPRTIDHLSGQLYLDPRHLQVKTLSGRELDTTLTVNGLLELTTDPPTGRLDVALKNLAIDQRLRDSLPEQWQPLFDVYSPSGRADVSATLQPTGNGLWRFSDSVFSPKNCRIRHARFPYPLENITGTLTQKGRTKDLLVEIDAIASGRPIHFRGQVLNAGPAAQSQINLSVDRLPINQRLFQAVSPNVRRSLEAMKLAGAADIRGRLIRPPGLNQKLTTTLNGRFVDVSVRYQGFPWLVEEIGGEFTAAITPKDYSWHFNKLAGRHATASLTGSGNFDGRPGHPGHFQLDLETRRVPMDADLRAACSKELQQLWDRVRLGGFLDGRVEIRRQGTQPTRVSIPRFTVDSGTLQLTGFPYKLTDAQATGRFGRSDTNQRRLTLTSFVARHGPTRVTSKGVLEIDRRKDWMLRLDPLLCEGLVADNDLRDALPGRLRDTVASLNPERPFDLEGLIELRGAGDPGFPITAAWNLQTRLPNNRLSAGVQLENVIGQITSRGKWYGQHAEMTGQFALESASLWGYRFRDIRGPFQYRNQDLVLGSSQAFAPLNGRRANLAIPLAERVTARAVGGLFTLDAQARINKQSTYHVKMNLSEAKLQQFARQYLRDPKNLKGVMRGWVDLRGKGNSPSTITGRGQLQISPAELYELPIVVQLFDVLSLGPPQQTAFRYAQCDFQLANSRFRFNSIDLVGNSLQLRGRGEATFAGQVGLDFYSMLPQSRLPIPFLQPLIAPLTTGWVAVRVDGKANNPQARIRPAPVFDDALRGFLSALDNPAGRRQLPPLNAPFGHRRRTFPLTSPAARTIDSRRRR